MTAEFETAGVCTETWWSSSNGTLSSCFLPRSTEISLDINGFEWQNIDIIDAQTQNESHLNTSTFTGNTNLDSTSQINVWNQSNLNEEEILNPINSFLEGLFDSSEELYVPDYAKLEQLESFHFFDDVFLNESRTRSVFDHESGDKPEEGIQACKSLTTCKRTSSEKTQKVEDVKSSSPLKKPRLETPSHFPSFKVRKEKLGDRITALQQLVSPFGKTDTASVLNDAIEYIKFLQEQITFSDKTDSNTHYEDCSPRQDLRSRGLCLMPISSTFSTSPQHLEASSFWN